ncbi:MAG: dephospho-CoA kinase [Pseudomonadota bacterium]
MIVLGLTGSIGMGKSTTASMFRQKGIPVYDADAEVHALYDRGGAAVGPLSEKFPSASVDGRIDRTILRGLVVGKPDAMSELERIVHPLVGESQLEFRQNAITQKSALIVLDIPLLFETGGDKRCDYVAVVTASQSIQRDRVLARQNMNEDELDGILAKQMSDNEKRSRADFVISTAFGLAFTEAHVGLIVDLLSGLGISENE